jgi:site-specific recombinase XerD
MNRPDSLQRVTLGRAFEQFLESTSFARRTRESYTDDLTPLLTQYGQAEVSVLTTEIIQTYLARQETLAPTTYNRRLAALRSFLAFLHAQGWYTEDLLVGVTRKPERTRGTRALDAQHVESVLHQITDPRDRALFWLIYDGGLRCQEALAIDIEDISWPDRSILIHGKGDRPREMFFSRAVGTLLDKYLLTRGSPRSGPFQNSSRAPACCCQQSRAAFSQSHAESTPTAPAFRLDSSRPARCRSRLPFVAVLVR